MRVWHVIDARGAVCCLSLVDSSAGRTDLHMHLTRLDTFRTHDGSLQHTRQRQKRSQSVQTLRAQQTRGQGKPPSASWHRGSLPAERRTSSGGRRENAKVGLCMLPCPGSIGSVSHDMLRSNMKWSSACGPYLFASLNSLAAARTLMTSKALRQGHSASQNGPPFCASIFLWGKVCSSCCFERERGTNEIKV